MTTTHPVPATKAAFLAEYETRLAMTYEWAQDEDRLKTAMEQVRTTINTDKAPWFHKGPTTIGVWKRMGFKGQPTLKALRALPDA